MSDDGWVLGRNVTWDGITEVDDGIGNKWLSVIRAGHFLNINGAVESVRSSSFKFRKPAPDPDPDGERWRNVMAKLGDARLTIRWNGTYRLFNHNGVDIEFENDAELDAYLGPGALMNANERIRLALTGDDGRCVDGHGSEDRERIAAAVIDLIKFGSRTNKCLIGEWPMVDCSAAQKAVGNDLMAIRLWMWDNRSGQPWQKLLEDHVLGKVCPCKDTDIQILGATVKASPSICADCRGTGRIGGWREAAPNYDSEDGMNPLKAALRARRWLWDVQDQLTHFQAFIYKKRPKADNCVGAPGDTEHSALYAATVAAIGGSDD